MNEYTMSVRTETESNSLETQMDDNNKRERKGTNCRFLHSSIFRAFVELRFSTMLSIIERLSMIWYYCIYMVYKLKTCMSLVKLLNAFPVKGKAKSVQIMQISLDSQLVR